MLKKRKYPDDIQIDHRRWIALPTPKDGFDSAPSIDKFIEPAQGFWKNLETECAADCCGICAFKVWDTDVRRARVVAENEDVEQCLDQLHEFITNTDHPLFVSTRLNQYFPREALLELIEHMSLSLQHQSGEQGAAPNH